MFALPQPHKWSGHDVRSRLATVVVAQARPSRTVQCSVVLAVRRKERQQGPSHTAKRQLPLLPQMKISGRARNLSEIVNNKRQNTNDLLEFRSRSESLLWGCIESVKVLVHSYLEAGDSVCCLARSVSDKIDPIFGKAEADCIRVARSFFRPLVPSVFNVLS